MGSLATADPNELPLGAQSYPETELERKIRACTVCAEHLPREPKPIVRLPHSARIAIISQAPGRLAHESGIPWDAPSGRRLRVWLGVTEDEFFHSGVFAILPSGFCYPGKGKSGDLPPRRECSPLWHPRARTVQPRLELKLSIGTYALKRYLPATQKRNLTETVRHYSEYLPEHFPLVHPSPLNGRWLRKNPWYEEEVIPVLQSTIRRFLVD
mgnify:CR=1 FL=1